MLLLERDGGVKGLDRCAAAKPPWRAQKISPGKGPG
jgi:hypothetical protein